MKKTLFVVITFILGLDESMAETPKIEGIPDNSLPEKIKERSELKKELELKLFC